MTIKQYIVETLRTKGKDYARRDMGRREEILAVISDHQGEFWPWAFDQLKDIMLPPRKIEECQYAQDAYEY